jgi:hypothetical protein
MMVYPFYKRRKFGYRDRYTQRDDEDMKTPKDERAMWLQ